MLFVDGVMGLGSPVAECLGGGRFGGGPSQADTRAEFCRRYQVWWSGVPMWSGEGLSRGYGVRGIGWTVRVDGESGAVGGRSGMNRSCRSVCTDGVRQALLAGHCSIMKVSQNIVQ